MAKPNSYRKVSESTLKRCNTCKHFTKLTSWCNRWNFIAKELYVCGKWSKVGDDIPDESELKKRYKVAAGEKLIVREENYAKPYTPDPNEDDYKDGFIYRYFAKQKKLIHKTRNLHLNYFQINFHLWTITLAYKEKTSINPKIICCKEDY